jgi:nitrogen-specific signal transduction histidine kinase
VALLSRDPLVAQRARRLLGGAIEMVVAGGLRDALRPGPGAAPPELVLLDLDSAALGPEDWALVERRDVPGRPGRPFLLGLTRGEGAWLAAERCDLVVSPDLPDAALWAAVEQALRVQRLEVEVASLRRERGARAGLGGPAALPAPAAGAGSAALGTVLKEMGKLLAAHFDLDRVVDFFLDAIGELARPSRAALVLLDDEGRYRVRGQRGLDPGSAGRLRLSAAEGLPAWFRQHGRLATLAELAQESEWLDATQELSALGGIVAVPLWVQAKLVGVLTLGPRITGLPYTPDDQERLFTLASQVAMAVEDISLFNTVRTQHSFIEQVLTHLQSGAITIDLAGRVTRLNRRAEELLAVSVGEVLGQDLRALPSPLGDLLFETLSGGREYRLHEVTVARRPGSVLEVNTSRIQGSGGAAAGAVMILDDPSPRHRLHREREASQSLDLLNRVLLRLTDEIKNPLVSIFTFLELLPQRYDDPEFRETFLEVVGRDTRHLVSLVDKLIILAGEREYKADFCDLRELLNEALEDLAVRLERPRPAAEATFFLLRVPDRTEHLTAVLYVADGDLWVKADRDQLAKALAYLVRFLVARVDPRGRVAIHVLPDPDQPQAIRLTLLGKPAALSAVEREQLFSPLAIASERLLDVGPGVSQKIIEGHGGSLTLGPQDGEVRFVVTLPRTQP